MITVPHLGHGIAVSDLPYFFDPRCTTAAVGQETGLGLSLRQSIIK